jgi:hypothetical protein
MRRISTQGAARLASTKHEREEKRLTPQPTLSFHALSFFHYYDLPEADLFCRSSQGSCFDPLFNIGCQTNIKKMILSTEQNGYLFCLGICILPKLFGGCLLILFTEHASKFCEIDGFFYCLIVVSKYSITFRYFIDHCKKLR